MAVANKTPNHSDTANQVPHDGGPPEIWGVERDGDRSTAEPAPQTLDWRNHMPDSTPDMLWTSEGVISDRNMITARMAKNHAYDSVWDMHGLVLATLDEIIRDPKKLHTATALVPEQFDYLCIKFAERLAELGLNRLFWDDDNRASDPGTRSKLYIRHALLLSLIHKRGATNEGLIGLFFGIDQSTVSRYLKVNNEVLAEILPTSRNLTKIIRGNYARDGTTKGETAKSWAEPPPQTRSTTRPAPVRPGPLSTSGPSTPVATTDESLIPTMIGAPADGSSIPEILAGPTLELYDGQLSTKVATITDGMHTQVNDSDWNKATHSGRMAHTYNTIITISTNKFVTHISDTVIGSTNDITLLRNKPPDFEPRTDAAANQKDEHQININDRINQGIQKDDHGAEIGMGIKRNSGSDPETRGLTQKELDHNAEVTRRVEHVIGEIKQYALMSKRYGGTLEQFNDELNVITGLVNFKRMWDDIKIKEDSLMAQLRGWKTR